MIFATSALFLLLVYGLMGFWPLQAFASHLAPRLPYVDTLVFQGLAAVFWLLCFCLLWGINYFYTGMLFHREGRHRIYKSWLQINGCRWMNVIGGVSVVAAGCFLGIKGVLPHTHWPLVFVLGVTFLDAFKRPFRATFQDLFPAPRFDPPQDLPQDSGILERHFSWTFLSAPSEPVSLACTCRILEDTYRKATEMERFPQSPPHHYCRYVRDGATAELQTLAAWFRSKTIEKHYSPVQEVLNVVGMVRSIPYQSDEETHGVADYADFPVELLIEQAGDCEDHAILACGILWLLGHDVGLVYMQGESSGHLALGYHKQELEGGFCLKTEHGLSYHYIETVPTALEESIGKISDDFLRNLPNHTLLPIGT